MEVELESKQRIEDLRVADFEDERQREREVRDRIRNMKLEAARKEAEQAVSPLREGLSQITGKIFDAATEMAEKLRDADFVPGSLAKRARQMCDWYNLMNFTADSELESVLSELSDAHASACLGP